MTYLQCSVQECTYNTQNCCCAKGIHVEGAAAHQSEETCCETFAEKNGATNAADQRSANRCMTISCDADNCVYNRNRMCTAESVDIHGANCHSKDQTNCGTFKSR